MTKILVVDDQRAIRNTIQELLVEEGYLADVAASGEEALKMALKGDYNLIISDIKLGGMDGIAFFKELHGHHPEIPVLMISGHATVRDAVDLIRAGAYDLLEKPFDLNILLSKIKDALEVGVIKQEKKIRGRPSIRPCDIIGSSPLINDMLLSIELAGESDAKVLITGSNGSGKELVARRIHLSSKRRSKPFVEVNCAAIPSELIESELFGHEKGSFTSAIRQKKGLFEVADGGTLFLDEIGDMSLSAQAKLLRAIQEMRITRVGGDKDIAVDVRIVAATNKNLLKEINLGSFRLDLFHRINVVHIEVPSLDDRREDIPILVEHFLNLVCCREGRERLSISKEGLKLLMQRSWPGNVRELGNVIERLVVYCRTSEIDEKLVKLRGMVS